MLKRGAICFNRKRHVTSGSVCHRCVGSGSGWSVAMDVEDVAVREALGSCICM